MRLDQLGSGGAGCALVLLLLACGGKSTSPSSGAPSSPSGGGDAACSGEECRPSTCDYEGASYDVGSTFTSARGEDCTCEPDGDVRCQPGAASPLISCEGVVDFYDRQVQDAKHCDPHSGNTCTLRVKSSLGCGCSTFVNPRSWNPSLASAYETHYAELVCPASVECPPCREPMRGSCSVMDGCMDDYDAPPGPGCKVDGTVYGDGAEGLPDPTSCNTCTCAAGKLLCGERDCPRPCPDGTILTTSCAQCGPFYPCDVVEHACRPTCTDACEEGLCVGGACIDSTCE